MGNKVKICKSLVAGFLAVAMLFTAHTGSDLKVKAAQFNGTSFGVGFAGEEYGTMHKADGWSNGGMFNCTWRAANIWFDGYLNIKIDRDTNGGYSGGEYRTNDAFGYGMYDVSMKPIKNTGVVSSFFTYTGPSDGTVWDEIDIEFLGKDTTKVQFNYYTNGQGNHEYLHNLGFDASQSFHQYGFLWQPGKITWYVDGKAVHTATNNIPTTPGKIMLNAWPGTGVDSWLGAYNGRTPLVAQYDWINYKKVDNGGSSNNNNNNWNNNTNNNNNNTNNNVSSGSTSVPTVGSNFTIEAEKYNYMQGVEPAGGVVGYIDPGDWMSYEVNVQTAGTYSVEFRVATEQSGKSFRLEKDSGKTTLANVSVPNTGNWGSYKSVWADVYLTAGKNNLAIATNTGSFNIDKMVFSLKGGNTRTTTTTTNNNNYNNNNNNYNNNNNNNYNNNNASSGMEGVYFIKNVHSGKYLDVANGSSANSANIQQWDKNYGTAQKFKLVSAGNDYYYLYTGCSGYSKVVDVSGRSSANGANILQYQFSGADNQKFKLKRESDGSYAILSKISNDRSGLDVYNWSTSAGGNVNQWEYWGGACQKWILERTN